MQHKTEGLVLDTVRAQEPETEGVKQRAVSDPMCLQLAFENERTFLAWACTGFLVMGFGLALARMRLALSSPVLTPLVLRPVSLNIVPPGVGPTSMGIAFLLAGLLVIIAAACRHCVTAERIRRGDYRHADGGVLLLLTIAVILSGLVGFYLLELRGGA